MQAEDKAPADFYSQVSHAVLRMGGLLIAGSFMKPIKWEGRAAPVKHYIVHDFQKELGLIKFNNKTTKQNKTL